MRYGFELFVAWRYLRERGTRAGYMVFYIGLGLLGITAVCFTLAGLTEPLRPSDLIDGKVDWKLVYSKAGLGFLVPGLLVGVFGFLRTKQSIFTAISTCGVWLGSLALIIVLSVMNGFEVDLRQKILGSNAHVLITKEDGPFLEWREVEDKIHKVCAPDVCVVAHTPYVSSEVVVSANSNYNGVIIKGIDPKTVGDVTDLRKYVRSDSAEAMDRLWPILPDGGVGVYSSVPDAGVANAPGAPDAGVGAGDDDGPIDFSGGAGAGEEEEAEAEEEEEEEGPIDFSVPRPQREPDAGREPELLTLPLDPFDPEHPRHRPFRPDPRVASLDGILVGRELAKNLHLYVGQEVQVVSPLGQDTPAGQVPRTRPFRVAGIFFSGMYEYDTKFVYVSLPALQRFLSMGDEVTGVEIKVSDMDETESLVTELQARLGASYRVQDWKEINRNLFSALKLEKVAMFSVLAIIIIVASLSIVLNLIMVVVEKGKEIAILKSMGSTDVAVMRVFMFEGLYIGAMGTGLGLVTGIGACLALKYFGLPLDPNVYYIDKLPVAMDPFAIVMVAVAGIGISVLVTLYPSWVAAKLRPVDGLRYE